MTRPIPIREESARLIYQTWQHMMCEIDQGHMVYDWQYMPGDVREAWEDAVSSHINWLFEGVVGGLADRLVVSRDQRHKWSGHIEG